MDTRATRSASAVHVLVADRHPIVRFGLRQLLQHESDFAVIGEAADGRETVRLANALQPDVLLLELATLQFSGLEAVRALTARGQSVRIIVMATSTEKLDVVGALQLGVRGVLWTHTALEFVARSIRRVM